MGVNFAKLCHTMKFQRSVANAHDVESISKARHDKNGADPSNPCVHSNNETNDTYTSYNSWLVSFLLLFQLYILLTFLTGYHRHYTNEFVFTKFSYVRNDVACCDHFILRYEIILAKDAVAFCTFFISNHAKYYGK